MKTYSVKEIAGLLNTNPETVRRWIRSGKLNATILSRKDGHVVSEDVLYKFLKSKSKYAAFAAAMAATNPYLLIGTIIGTGVFSFIESSKINNSTELIIPTDSIKKHISIEIKKGEKKIENYKNEILILQQKIIEEENKIKECCIYLKSLSENDNSKKGGIDG